MDPSQASSLWGGPGSLVVPGMKEDGHLPSSEVNRNGCYRKTYESTDDSRYKGLHGQEIFSIVKIFSPGTILY
jgi:hypothetical protein